MPEFTEVQKKLLKKFYQLQLDSGYFIPDKVPHVLCSKLDKDIGIDPAHIQFGLIELRNMGLIWLAKPTDQSKFPPSAHGWSLTDPKGVDIVRELFFT